MSFRTFFHLSLYAGNREKGQPEYFFHDPGFFVKSFAASGYACKEFRFYNIKFVLVNIILLFVKGHFSCGRNISPIIVVFHLVFCLLTGNHILCCCMIFKFVLEGQNISCLFLQ